MENLRNRKASQKSQTKDVSPEPHEKSNLDELQKQELKKVIKLSKHEYPRNNDFETDEINNDFEDECSSSSRTRQIIGRMSFELDIISISLFMFGLLTRLYKLDEPRNIV